MFHCTCGGILVAQIVWCVAALAEASRGVWPGQRQSWTAVNVMPVTNPSATRQRARALERANQVRGARAALKRQVARGQRAASEVILICPAEAARMPISELLRSQRGWGNVRCRAFLNRLALREDKPVGSLTERQRSTVASLLTRSGNS